MNDTVFYETFQSGFCIADAYANHDACPGDFAPYGKTLVLSCHCECHDGKPRRMLHKASHVNTDAPVVAPKTLEANSATPTRVATPKVSTVNVEGLDIGAVRAWAIATGLSVGVRGRIAIEIKQAYLAAH